MGMEDRDYYREDHAKRQGMRYNKKKARYQSDDTSWYDPKKYRRDRVSRAGPLPDHPDRPFTLAHPVRPGSAV